jgi:hypothetical protein
MGTTPGAANSKGHNRATGKSMPTIKLTPSSHEIDRVTDAILRVLKEFKDALMLPE